MRGPFPWSSGILDSCQPIAVLPSLEGSSQALALTSAGLLIFVSVGVLYLSTVEWRDRRRRSKDQQSRQPQSRAAARSGKRL